MEIASWLENRKVARQTRTMPFSGWSIRFDRGLWELIRGPDRLLEKGLVAD
ncbi:hypothetical protein D3C78_1976630 [compost metagenome]